MWYLTNPKITQLCLILSFVMYFLGLYANSLNLFLYLLRRFFGGN